MAADNNNDVDDLDFSDLDLDDGAGGETYEDQPRKKGPDVITLAIYAMMGLAVVGVVVWQLGLLGGSKSTPSAENSAEVVQAPTDAPSDPFNVMGTPTEEPAMQLDSAMEAAPAATPAADGSSIPAELTEAMDPAGAVAPATSDPAITSVMPAAEATAAPESASAIPGVTGPAPVAATDTVPMPAPVADATMPAPVVTAEALPAAPATPDPVPVDVPVATETTLGAADMAAIMTRLEAIEKRLDTPAASDASPAMASEIQELKATVAALQAGKESMATASVVDEAKPPVKKKPAKKKKKVSKPKKSTTSSDAPYKGGADIAAPMATSIVYTLRAAQTGAAYVSDGAGTLQEVRVGDKLPGIGEVRAISEGPNGWSVVGADGRITQ